MFRFLKCKVESWFSIFFHRKNIIWLNEWIMAEMKCDSTTAESLKQTMIIIQSWSIFFCLLWKLFKNKTKPSYRKNDSSGIFILNTGGQVNEIIGEIMSLLLIPCAYTWIHCLWRSLCATDNNAVKKWTIQLNDTAYSLSVYDCKFVLKGFTLSVSIDYSILVNHCGIIRCSHDWLWSFNMFFSLYKIFRFRNRQI